MVEHVTLFKQSSGKVNITAVEVVFGYRDFNHIGHRL